MDGYKKRAQEADARIAQLEAKYTALAASNKGGSSGSGDDLQEFKKKSLESLYKIREVIGKENAEFEAAKQENATLKKEHEALKAELASLEKGKGNKSSSSSSSAAPASGDAPLFTINGFYMAMRDKYTSDKASIHYFVAEWDSAKLSWKDFRGKVLGATDPVTAEPNSLRNVIYKDWKSLGLTSEPNVGDNGVHASASPFEALAERINWLSVSAEKDEFGAQLLKIISPEDLAKWTKDPQIELDGEKRSLFDSLEDTDAQEVLDRAVKIAGSKKKAKSSKNSAFIFIKPHAVTDDVISLVRDGLEKAGLKVLAEGDLDGPTIEEKKLIDNHYYAIAVKASLTHPRDLHPSDSAKQAFAAKFGLSWEEALEKDYVVNALEATKRLAVDGATLDDIWAKAKKGDQLVKFGGGFYCGKISAGNAAPKGSQKGAKKDAPGPKESKSSDSKKSGSKKAADKEQTVPKKASDKKDADKKSDSKKSGSKKDQASDDKKSNDSKKSGSKKGQQGKKGGKNSA